MKRLGLPILILIALLALAMGLGWLAVLGVRASVAWVLAQESQIAAAIIATSGPLLAAVLAYVIGQQRSKSREIAEAHRPKKVELYNEFLTEMIKFLHRFRDEDVPKDPNLDPELLKFFTSFTKNLMLWGSSGVIGAWSQFRSQAEAGGMNALLKFDDLVRAIRRDLGHRNWMLERGQLVKLILSDPHNVDALLQK